MEEAVGGDMKHFMGKCGGIFFFFKQWLSQNKCVHLNVEIQYLIQ